MTIVPNRIGKCSIKVQGKIILKLEGDTLPKIGSQALLKINDHFKVFGKVIEAIGSTKSPWLVISSKKKEFDEIKNGEEIYINNLSIKKNLRRVKKGKKFKSRS